MIYTLVPYMDEGDKNFAQTCNRFMELIPDDNDFAIIMDHDAMFTTHTWMNQVHGAIKRYPEANAFCAVTNRISAKFLWANVNKDDNDMAYHFKRGGELSHTHGTDCAIGPPPTKDERGWGGYFFMIRKSAWKEIGGFRIGRSGGVDWNSYADLHAKGEQVHVLLGVYIYHWYSNFNPEGYAKGRKRKIKNFRKLVGRK